MVKCRLDRNLARCCVRARVGRSCRKENVSTQHVVKPGNVPSPFSFWEPRMQKRELALC